MKKVRIKILSMIILISMLLSTVQPIFAITPSGGGRWVAGQYDTKVLTTDSKKGIGILARRLINYDTKERITTFCGEHFINSPTGTIEEGTHSVPSDSKVKEACKVAYFGWYSKYGDYVVDGGILAEDMKWVKLDYVFTQQMIWEKLGQSNATFLDSSIQAMYENFKNDINSKIARAKRQPSFVGKILTVNVGENIINDTNDVLRDYENLDKTENGVRIIHVKGENQLKIIIDENCNIEHYRVSNRKMQDWGMIKGETKNRNTTVFITFRKGVQDQLYALNYNDPVSMSLELNIELYGKIELEKLDEEHDLINGAKFLITGNNYNKEVEVVNGKLVIDKLKKGKYKIKETYAPNGYVLNDETYQVEVKPNQTTKQTIINKEPTGTIILVKRDKETASKAQGDATFNGAKYELRADEDIFNVAKTKKFYDEDELVATRIMNTEGTTDVIENLPMGKYKVKEIISSEGYLIDTKEYKIELKYQGQNVKIVTQTVTSNEVVKRQKIHIFKSGIKEHSGEVNGLAGAEFSFKLEKEVNKALENGYTYAEIWEGISENGDKTNVNSVRALEAQKIAPTYEKIVTDSEGNAYTKRGLPYGKYLGKETKTPKDYETADDFSFSITKDESEIKEIEHKIKHIFVNNTPLETYIKLIKKDKETGKIVTLNSTTFKIKASEDIIDRGTGKIIYKKGEEITQKVGKTIYNTFTTNADNKVVPKNSYNSKDDSKGEVVTPLKLTVGKYQVDEIITPNGFLRLENPITFEISNIKNYDQDPHGDYIKEVVIKNDKPTGEIIVDKKINYRDDVDKTLFKKDYEDYDEIEFTIIAKENIIDVADGSIIYKKGDVVDIIKLDTAPRKVKRGISNLPMGIYEIYESKTKDGLVFDDTRYEIKLEQKDNKTKFYVEEKEIFNDTTLVEFSKTDITGEKELVGAKLTVLDENGKVIDTWTSTDKTHKIEGLTANKEYILREEIAPDGFVKSTDVKFKVENTKEIQKVKMIDKIVEVVKTDLVTGEEIEGAKLEVRDENDKVIDSWISTKDAHIVKGLEEDKKYKLVEITAPYGYEISEKIEFVVSKDKKTQKIEMKDNPILKDIKLIKVDQETKENIKEKFTFGIYEDKECTKLIKEIKSNKNDGFIIFNDLRYGKYFIKEIKSPKGYVKSNKVTKVEINDKGVFIDGEKAEGENKIYTFEFYNTPMDTPKTNDISNISLWTFLLAVSVLGTVGIEVYERNKKKKLSNKK